MILMTLLLLAEGWIVAHRLLRKTHGHMLEALLSLPLGALINVFAIAVLSLLSIELNALSIIGSNLLIATLLLISVQPLYKTKSPIPSSEVTLKVPLIFTVVSCFILASSLVYAVSHTLLPTFHYDSTTNWNMRSKVSYERAEVIFDDSDTLVSKSQYPFLYHSLQITVNEFSPRWSDKSANGIHLLLTLSLLGALYVLLSHRGKSYGLIVMALIMGIPLLTLHSGQSYADITLIGFALVCLSALLEYRKEDDTRFLLLSGLMLCSAVWTKSDGLFFCYIPWVIVMSVILVRKSGSIAALRYPIGYSVLLSLSWPLFAIVKKLSLTPHGSSDSAFTLNLEAIPAFSKALFVTGSFGIYWYALLSILTGVFIGIKRGTIAVDNRYLITVLWGLIALAGYMGVYLLTSNAEYLIIGQSFDRQMLLPASLLTLSLSYTLIPRRL